MKKSPIASELEKRGFVRYSKEWNKEYQRLWREMNREKVNAKARARRQDPEVKKRERESWKRYYQKKIQENPKWNNDRIKEWRISNPEKWASLMSRASKNGLHKRWYEKHKEKKLERIKESRRKQNPSYGLNTFRNKFKRGEITPEEFIQAYRRALSELDGESHE